MVAPLIRRNKLLIQCPYCLRTELKTSLLTFKADRSEDAGSLACLCSLLRFDCPAKLFNQVWNHKKSVVLHCPQTKLLLIAARGFRSVGTGGRAQPCESAVAGWATALLLCRRAKSCVEWTWEKRCLQAQRTRKLKNIWNLCGLCGKTLTMWLLSKLSKLTLWTALSGTLCVCVCLCACVCIKEYKRVQE